MMKELRLSIKRKERCGHCGQKTHSDTKRCPRIQCKQCLRFGHASFICPLKPIKNIPIRKLETNKLQQFIQSMNDTDLEALLIIASDNVELSLETDLQALEIISMFDYVDSTLSQIDNGNDLAIE